MVGVYGVAVQLGSITSILADAFGKAYGPWMYERLQRHTLADDLAVVGATYLAVPAFLALAGLATVALMILGPLILGERFQSALSLVGWFALGGAFNGIYVALTGFFFFSSRTELISVCTVSSSLIGLALAFWLVSYFGLNGGGAAYAATHAICLALTFAFSTGIRRMPWGSPVAAVREAIRQMG
jgi:O-antigen/teichoic acid export membrane protein